MPSLMTVILSIVNSPCPQEDLETWLSEALKIEEQNTTVENEKFIKRTMILLKSEFALTIKKRAVLDGLCFALTEIDTNTIK